MSQLSCSQPSALPRSHHGKGLALRRDDNNMPQTKEKDIRVGFDREFIEKWLDRQRYVWYAVILLLGLTLTGLLGRGPLAKRTISAGPGQLEVTYERITHFKTPAAIELHLPQKAFQDGHVRILLEGALAHEAAFQEIIPQPISAVPLPDGIAADIPVTAASAAGRVMIFQQPSAVGALKSRIGLEGGPRLAFTQFVLP